ncbi:glycosyltransferase family 2 protein [Halomonas sp. MC140]|nr:glycosyltransferase family 2 protein [Halomonas sp. MC140]MDN7131514.1 glycosyltransferase family 2 protein [Halomonas sp. MC140]
MVDRALPPVSIGIPFYNAERFLLDSIKSVFAQTHQDWELILMDDGSTDRSLEIARSIDDPRVRVYSDGQNKKLAARLNEIHSLAMYDYVARMDADDLMAQTRIEQQLIMMLDRPELDLVATGVCSLTDGCEPVGIRCVASGHRITARTLLAGQSGIVHASVLGHREWFSRNPYREDLAKSQDTNLWVRAFSKDDLSIAIIQEPLYYYREDGNVTAEKLLLAYRIGRVTVREDASGQFSFRVRAKALLTSYAKSATVTVLSLLGRIDMIRRRRNRQGIDEAEKAKVMCEIKAAREFEIPIVQSGRAEVS